MRSTFAGLNTMVRGIYSHQIALDTVGNNITNINTDGYSRQRTNLVETSPEYVYGGTGALAVGTGDATDSIVRLRDELIDNQVRRGASPLGYSNTQKETLGKIELIFSEPSDSGFQTAMNNFWNAWQQLSTDGSDEGSRSVVRQRGIELVDAVQRAASQLKNIQADATASLKADVKKLNQYLGELAAVNKQILVSPSSEPNALKDQQDLLLEKISTLAPIQVQKDANGSAQVVIGGLTVVDRDHASLLDENVGDTGGLKMADTGVEVKLGSAGGELQGLIDSRDSTTWGAPVFLEMMGTVSQFLLNDFNAAHRSGYGLDNGTNVNFFGDTTYGTGSATIGTTLQQASSEKVAASAAVPASVTLTITDGTGTMDVNLAAGWTVAQVTEAINNQATAKGINVRAAYDTENQQFQLYTTGSAKTATVTEPATSTYWKNVLKMDEPKASYWVDQLKINPTLTGDGGLKKIAARTGQAQVGLTDRTVKSSNIWQANATGGAMTATVSGTYTFDPASLPIRVRIDAYTTNTDGTRVPSQLSYSTDGKTWTTATGPDSDKKFQFTVQGATVKMSIAANAANEKNDIYMITLPAGNEASSGDNCVILSNLLKTTSSTALGNTSLDGYYSNLIATLGTLSQNAQTQATNQDSLVSQTKTMRDAVSGVNLDEELTAMIKYQKGYNGCARMLTAMDELLDKLINGTGTVGR